MYVLKMFYVFSILILYNINYIFNIKIEVDRPSLPVSSSPWREDQMIND